MKRHLLAALILLPMIPVFASGASAEVNVTLGVSLPLVGVTVSTRPEVAVIPGTYVYFMPDADENLFFYHGYWYRTHRGRWYRSAEFDRGWVVISLRKTPSPVREIPPGFRSIPPGHQKIPYGQLKKNWKSWEKERHWDRVSKAEEHHDRHGKGRHKNR